MRMKIKSRIFAVVLTFLVALPAIYVFYNNLNDFQNDYGAINLNISEGEAITGLYDGGISTLGLKGRDEYYSWDDKNQTSILNAYNQTYGEYIYTLNRLDIRAYNIYNGNGSFSIAENDTTPTAVSDGYLVAQEFTTDSSPALLAIDSISLYLDHGNLNKYLYYLYIFDENINLDNPLGYNISVPPEKSVQGWVTFKMSSNILEANTNYTIVFYIRRGISTYYTTNTWKAENKTVSDKGLTRIYDGDNYVQIHNDSYRDMLCNFTFQKILNPSSLDLKYNIDGQDITPVYQKSLSTGSLGYEALFYHYFDSPPSEDINVTIYTNSSVESLNISIRQYYVYTINSTGTFSISGNTIEWDITYPYYDINALGPQLWFLYEPDWDLQHFYNTLESEVLEVYFGPMTIYNESFYGSFDLWGTPLEIGNCRGIYQSPNYCHEINSKIQTGGIFLDSGYLQLGKTVKLEAEIRNALDEPISGGTGNLTLRNPSGEIIYNGTNLKSYNGILSSSEIFLESTYPAGTYEIDVFWTNGKEIAYYTIQVEVRHPEGYISPELIILILAIVGLSVCSVPIALATKKRVQRRNWEKTLHNLFVLSKDGVPLYDYTFGIEVKQTELITGMISALTTFMKEATGSKKGVRSIDQQDKKIILHHGEHTTIAMVCEKDLPIIHDRIKKFSNEFERYYGKRLVNWSGGTSMFKYTEKIITKYFPVSVEDQIIRGVRQKLIEFRERLKTIEDPKQIFSIMREITEFASRYHEIINVHSSKNYSELIKMAEEKIRK